mmetsp:Transcript_75303/g.172458  ORF Transcript_75303/g.172458 Transcript_75303/m.172458 type:complete len:210 (+) Transcript_75303:42-671(+)
MTTFLTGVNIVDADREVACINQPVRALEAPPPRRRAAPVDTVALPAPADFGTLLSQVSSYRREEEDPLDELRRMIKQTRRKMDQQTQVLDGFRKDVDELKRGGGRSQSSMGHYPGAKLAVKDSSQGQLTLPKRSASSMSGLPPRRAVTYAVPGHEGGLRALADRHAAMQAIRNDENRPPRPGKRPISASRAQSLTTGADRGRRLSSRNM